MTQLQSHLKRLQTHFKSEPGLILARDLEASFTIKHYGKVITINKDPTDIDMEDFDSSCDYQIIDNLQSKQIANDDDDESDDDADVIKTEDVATESIPPRKAQAPRASPSNKGVGTSYNLPVSATRKAQAPRASPSNKGVGTSYDLSVSAPWKAVRASPSNKGVGTSYNPPVSAPRKAAQASPSNKNVGTSYDLLPPPVSYFLPMAPDPIPHQPVQASALNKDLGSYNYSGDQMDLS
jgi:hypothetical protein